MGGEKNSKMLERVINMPDIQETWPEKNRKL